ncbi:helix-turn-helix domain-containing protein [Enterococcus cecorum]|uniref:helix-turn-helix domain-containing protein n=1 Tax=Enterococcus cecorum TaxID=44008 RepID=UPI0032C49B94
MQLLITQLLSAIDNYIRRVIREEVSAVLKASKTTDAYPQKETAQILGMSEATLIKKRKQGMIRAYLSGKHVMYTQSEINKFRENNEA